MINDKTDKVLERLLLGKEPFEQVMFLSGYVFDDINKIAESSQEELEEELFLGVQKMMRDWIEAGLNIDWNRWQFWGNYEGGKILQKLWIDAKTTVEDLRIAKMAKIIHDTLCGKGTAEKMILEALSPEQQDVIMRRIMRSKNNGYTSIS